jgi:bifunctional DNA-binding transcriptional regulator/antitoxin component of YhaV-PrlF toxin-antitoxin module
VSRISSNRQVTLPARVLLEAGLAVGDEVVIRVAGHGRVEVERTDDVIARFAGGLPAGTYSPGHLDQLRAEWGG